MNATKTPRKASAVVVRKGIAAKIAEAMHSIAKQGIVIGELLAEARATFKTDDTAAFLAWASATVGLGKSAVYDYMRAATTAGTFPAVLEKTDSIKTLSYLDRFTPDEKTAILAEVGKGHTFEDFSNAAAVVIDRVKVAKEKSDEVKTEKEKTARAASDQAAASVARKYSGQVGKALATLDAEASEEPGAAIRMALLIGAKWAAKTPTIVGVLPSLIAEYDTDATDANESDES